LLALKFVHRTDTSARQSLLANEQVALEAAFCRVEADLVLREAS
jgi:hypothetical protein